MRINHNRLFYFILHITHLLIKKKKTKQQQHPDPYVKVAIVSKGKRLKKKKTSVMKNTLHPVFNESMLFDIPQELIEQCDLVVKVIDYDRVGQNELIGCVGIGPTFNGVGRDHWYRMLENPRKPISQTYYLRLIFSFKS